MGQGKDGSGKLTLAQEIVKGSQFVSTHFFSRPKKALFSKGFRNGMKLIQ